MLYLLNRKQILLVLAFTATLTVSYSQYYNQFFSPYLFPSAVHISEGNSLSTNNSLYKIGNLTPMIYNLYGSFQFKNHGFNAVTNAHLSFGYNEFYYKIGYAYAFTISDNLKIVAGTNIGLNQLYHRKRTLIGGNPNDPFILEYTPYLGKSSYDFDIDIGFGLQFKKFDFQLSFNDLISQQNHAHIEQPRVIHFLTKYRFKFWKFNLNPSIYSNLLLYNAFTSFNAEFQLELGYNDRYFIAPIYQLNQRAGVRARVVIKKFSFFYGILIGIKVQGLKSLIHHEFGLKLQFNKPN